MTNAWDNLLGNEGITQELIDKINGSFQLTKAWGDGSVSSKSAAYTLGDDDDVPGGEIDYAVLCDATGGAFQVDLPEISTITIGRPFVVVKSDASGNAVTVARSGSDTIEGSTSVSLSSQYDKGVFVAVTSSLWLHWTL